MLDAKAQNAANLRTNDWYKSATRWTQLTLAEDDPVKFDPAFWIDVFKRTKSNATCLSAGGYIAYYPSKVPLHYVSKFIGETDPFGVLVDGARQLGMVIQRVIEVISSMPTIPLWLGLAAASHFLKDLHYARR